MPGCYLIAYNGAIVYDCGNEKVLKKESLPLAYVKELFERAKKAGLYIQTYKGNQIITTQDSPELEAYRNHTKLPYQVVEDVFAVLDEEPQKAMLIHLTDKSKLEQFQKVIWSGRREMHQPFLYGHLFRILPSGSNESCRCGFFM